MGDEGGHLGWAPEHETAYVHKIGDVLQIFPGQPAQTVVARRSGHFGAVYLVSNPTHDRLSVYKSVRADREISDSSRASFAREAMRWIGIPRNVMFVEAFRTVMYGGRPYLHMEYIPPVCSRGATLADLLESMPASSRLAGGFALDMVGQLIQATLALTEYDSTFLHGDIKPSNILLRSQDQKRLKSISDVQNGPLYAALSDFGLATSLADAYANDANPLGDVSYLPPELLLSSAVRSSVKDVEEAVWPSRDCYALACTAFEVLTSRRWQQFDSKKLTTGWRGDREGTRRALVSLRPDIPPSVMDWLASALDPSPNLRWPNIATMWDEWKTAVSKEFDIGEVERHSPPVDRDLYPELTGLPTYVYYRSRGLDHDTAERICKEVFLCSNLINAGHLARGEQVADSLLVDFPWLAPAMGLKGYAATLSRREDEAMRLYADSVAAYEADPHFIKADVSAYAANCDTLAQLLTFSKGKQTGLAVDLARRAIALEPEIGRHHYSLGNALAGSSDFAGAVREFNEALVHDPGSKKSRISKVAARILAEKNPGSIPSMLDELTLEEIAAVKSVLEVFGRFANQGQELNEDN
jgi:serine/threonine protein kinase